MADHTYSSDFYSYIDTGSRRSAREVAALLLSQLKIDSLLDVGSGHGAWAREWLNAGVADIVAVDGDYVSADQLAIPARLFEPHDLTTPLDLGRRFDLVQSLEVAEHLPESKADQFIESLVRHGDIILFSAAVPNQGGEHHVNEQLPEYWRKKFGQRGYRVFDWLRPRLAGRKTVMPWYRFNSLLYANEAGLARLSEAISSTEIPSGTPLPAGGDLSWKLRRTVVALIPQGLIKPIAMAKAAVEARLR